MSTVRSWRSRGVRSCPRGPGRSLSERRKPQLRLEALEERLLLDQGLANVGLTAGWATFGQALPPGAAYDGLQIGTLQTQTDVKTRWPDGSIRFAVLSARVPLAGDYDVHAAAAEPGRFAPDAQQPV